MNILNNRIESIRFNKIWICRYDFTICTDYKHCDDSENTIR